MAFGIGALFDPLKFMKGTNLLGGPQLPTGPGGAPSLLKATEPIGTGAAPESPFKLLKAGGEDIVPPPLVGGPAANLATDRGVVIDAATPEANRAKSLYPDTPPQSAGAAARSDGPPLASPVQASAANPPPDATIRAPYQAPGTGGGPGAGIATPQPPPGVVASPGTGGGPSTTGSTTTGTGGAAAGPVPTKQLGQQSALSKLADMGKALGAAGGGAQGGMSGHAPGGVGQPHYPQGGAALLQSIMEANKTTRAAGAPGLPNVFAQRFRR